MIAYTTLHNEEHKYALNSHYSRNYCNYSTSNYERGNPPRASLMQALSKHNVTWTILQRNRTARMCSSCRERVHGRSVCKGGGSGAGDGGVVISAVVMQMMAALNQWHRTWGKNSPHALMRVLIAIIQLGASQEICPLNKLQACGNVTSWRDEIISVLQGQTKNNKLIFKKFSVLQHVTIAIEIWITTTVINFCCCHHHELITITVTWEIIPHNRSNFKNCYSCLKKLRTNT